MHKQTRTLINRKRVLALKAILPSVRPLQPRRVDTKHFQMLGRGTLKIVDNQLNFQELHLSDPESHATLSIK